MTKNFAVKFTGHVSNDTIMKSLTAIMADMTRKYPSLKVRDIQFTYGTTITMVHIEAVVNDIDEIQHQLNETFESIFGDVLNIRL